MAAVLLEALGKTYPAKRGVKAFLRRPFRKERTAALESVSFAIESGEAVAVLGPNGAGKTTLLKVLGGVVRPSAGRALVMGHDVARDPRPARIAVGLVTADERSFYQRLTARENLRFFAGLHGMRRAEREARIDELAVELRIDGLLKKTFNTLSSGQKARLAIARGLLHRPRVLLLDEVTRALDPGAAARLRAMVIDELVKKKGLATLLATHDLAEARAACERVILLEKGKVKADGRWPEVEGALSRTFFGEEDQ